MAALAAFGSVTALAENRIPEMEIDVALCMDGSAHITQTCTADTSEGTEFFLACRTNGYLDITDFAVSDEDGAYTPVESWDVNASFADKAGKCGIHEAEDGVELCWGISQYGHRRYRLEYVIHNLVGAYSDSDGFNHRFVDEMQTFPTDVTLTIRRQNGKPLTSDGCGIWAFGFEGEIQFVDGVVRAWTESALEDGQHMTVMVSLDKGVLSPARREAGSFEAVKERAFTGSDYEEEDGGSFWAGLAAFAVIAAAAVIAVKIAAAFRRARMRRRMGKADYFRDAPNNGNLNVTYSLSVCCELCREDALLGAYLLRLIGGGALEPEETGASPVNLRLVRPPLNDEPFDDAFYTILEAAAGTDGVLQAREFERFCESNSKPLTGFVESCRQNAERALARDGCYKGTARKGVKCLSTAGLRQLDEILGLKRFLLDFSLIHERGVEETVIWQDYLIYAHLLGIADQVAPQLRKLYPDALPEIERFERYIGYTGYYNRLLYGAYERERQRQEAARRSGGGGRASFGGGSGFSGGGGGGTR